MKGRVLLWPRNFIPTAWRLIYLALSQGESPRDPSNVYRKFPNPSLLFIIGHICDHLKVCTKKLYFFIISSKYSDEREKHFNQTFCKKSKSYIRSVLTTILVFIFFDRFCYLFWHFMNNLKGVSITPFFWGYITPSFWPQ